jgi:DEAD/DEAH box helicase domain-containing protein
MELGDYLRKHLFFQRLIELLDNKTLEEETLSSKINQVLRGFSNKSQAFQNAFIDSIFALVSFARRKIFTNDGKELSSPFLQVRSQLWLREMRRMVASVEENPKLRYAADLQANEAVLSLPVIHCRSCGHIGYLSTMHVGENKFSTDLQQIYSAFFAESPTVHYIFPYSSFYGQQEFPKMLCGHCLTLSDGDQISQCPSCGKDDKLLKVRVENPRHQSSNSVKVKHNCPSCDGEDTLTVLGSRSLKVLRSDLLIFSGLVAIPAIPQGIEKE